jgi:signal transduction histidine kinase
MTDQPPDIGRPRRGAHARGAAGTSEPANASAGGPEAGSAPFLVRSLDVRRWSIRAKLTVVLLIPTLAAVLLNGQLMQSALSSSAAHAREERLALATRTATELVRGLQDERDLTAGSAAGQTPPGIDRKREAVDQAGAALRRDLSGIEGSHNPSLQAKITAIVQGLDRIPSVRQAAASSAAAQYTTTIEQLLALEGEIPTESRSTELASQVSALESLSKATESASRQRAILYGAVTAGAFRGTAYTDLALAQAQQEAAVADFLSRASAAQRQRFQAAVRGPDVERVQQIESAALGGREPGSFGVNAQELFALMSRQMELLGKVGSSQLGDILTDIRQLRAEARRAALGGAVVYILLAVALVATTLVARSTLRPLRTLQSTAMDVAHRRLPDTVRQLQESQSGDDMPTVRPIGVRSRDEIGQVARAFDAVHHQAVRLAREQALMRTNIRAMFVNLSRRSQTLVQRQLRLIDELEKSEQDSDRLANLFRLDHLATRMRRNDENLLVLAGTDGGRRRAEPVQLVDVIRAANAEVEHYSRIHLDVQPGYLLTGPAVNDAVHLIAELLENATAFSPPETQVRVVARGEGLSGEVTIEVDDEGIGMAADALATANEKLATASVVDASMSQMMGLFVVARLARRQGIQVRLRPSSAGGITALVRLPAAIVIPPKAESQPSARLQLPEPTLPIGVVAGPPPIALASSVAGAPQVPAQSNGETERLPIFDALQSEWFRRPSTLDPADGSPASAGSVTSETASTWRSPGDEGWDAVANLNTQPDSEVTSAGLPKRVPGRNLLPGSAAPAAQGRVPSRRAPEQARTLSGYQQGIGRARAAGTTANGDPADATNGESPEEEE